MSKLQEIISHIFATPEVAAADFNLLDDPTPMDQYSQYLEAQLIRANAILDKKKIKVFSDILDINTRGEAERALTAYDTAYLMGLGLSLEATSELAKELIAVVKTFRVPAPQTWINIAKMNIEFERPNDDITSYAESQA